jgi:cell division protease FtsH
MSVSPAGKIIILIIILAALGGGALAFGLVFFQNLTQEITTGEFVRLIENNQLTKVQVAGDRIIGEKINNGGMVSASASKTMPIIINALEEHGTAIEYNEAIIADNTAWLGTLTNILFLVMFIVVGFVIFRALFAKNKDGEERGGSGFFGTGDMGQDRAVRLDGESKKTFADVGGIDEALEEVREIVTFLKDPAKFKRLGGRMPKGVLLVGPPGTGKTLLGRAVAGEAGVPFFSVSGSEFDEMFIGVGSARVRSLKKKLDKHRPCVCFIDELESLGRKRGVSYSSGQDEKQTTLNQFLQLMDGVDSSTGIVFMAASNQPDVLDSALVRAGRFDRHVHVPPPDIKGREIILGIHVRNYSVPLAQDADLKKIAQLTYGMTGADLENVVNEAALTAARSGLEAVNLASFHEAIDKIQMGLARKSMTITPEEKSVICVHEAGHVLAGYMNPNHDLPQKFSCVPRGPGLGVTVFAPETDRHLMTKQQLLAMIEALLGGRVAEKIVIGKITTGAGNDLERVKVIVKELVTRYAMADGLGHCSYGRFGGSYLGRELVENDHSEQTAQAIDQAIKRITDECFDGVAALFLQKKDTLLAIARELYKHETMTLAELLPLLGERPPAEAPFLLV